MASAWPPSLPTEDSLGLPPATPKHASAGSSSSSQPAADNKSSGHQTHAAAAGSVRAAPTSSSTTSAMRRYSKAEMHGILDAMELRVLTAKPAWTEGNNQEPSEDRVCVAGKKQVIENLSSVLRLLAPDQEQPFFPHRPRPQQQRWGSPDNRTKAHWGHARPAQESKSRFGAGGAAPADAAPAAAAQDSDALPHLKPIRTAAGASNPQHSNPDSTTTQTPAAAAQGACTPDTTTPLAAAGPSTNVQGDLGARRHNFSTQQPASRPCQASMGGSPHAAALTATSSASVQDEAPFASGRLPTVTPYTGLWNQTISRLLGLQNAAGGTPTTSWMIQQKNITGSMGPISAEDLHKWLVNKVTPRQLSRQVHRPFVEATAADPAGLLVCGLTPAEVDSGRWPDSSLFKPLRYLLPGVASGLDYSATYKYLVAVGFPAHSTPQASTPKADTTPAARDTGAAAQPAAAAAGPEAARQNSQQPSEPETPRSAKSQAAVVAARLLQHLAENDVAAMTAVAEEIRRLASSSAEMRAALVQLCAVPLVEMLQLLLDSSEGTPQTAAAGALYSLSGYSKAEPRATEAAITAMLGAGAVAALTAVLQAAWQQWTSPPSQQQGTSAASSDDSSSKARKQAAARVQQAAATALAAIASLSVGRAAISSPGADAIPCLVQLLGNSHPKVEFAALTALRAFTDSNSADDTRALWEAGVCAKLVGLVSSSKQLANQQVALSILWSIAASAPVSTVQRPAGAAAPSSPAATAGSGSEYTRARVVNSLLQLGLPSVLMKLLTDLPFPSYTPDPSQLVDGLRARAVLLLQLLACSREQEVLTAVRDYAVQTGGKSQQQRWVICSGVYVLQRLMSGSDSTVKEGAQKLLWGMAKMGMIDPGAVKAV